MTDSQIIEAAKRALELSLAATPGPWDWVARHDRLEGLVAKDDDGKDIEVVGYWVSYADDAGMEVEDDDKTFIAEARHLLPLLARAVLDTDSQIGNDDGI